jgi:hypothetical protein
MEHREIHVFFLGMESKNIEGNGTTYGNIWEIWVKRKRKHGKCILECMVNKQKQNIWEQGNILNPYGTCIGHM